VARVECYKGRGVRVVGRLMQSPTGAIEIMAEHIEYKPVFDKAKDSLL
jgi:hypothetical protein